MIDADRFWEKVSKGRDAGACWLWTAGIDQDGYGRFRHDGRPRLAHVIAWEIEHGAVPAGRKVHRISTCTNRACVRPDHLMVGDQRSAIRARDARGNGPAGERNAAAKMTADKARELRAAAAAGVTTRELAERFGLHTTTVSDIVAGRLWASAAPPAPASPAVGRPALPFNLEEAQRLRATGVSIRAIAATLSVPKSVLARGLAAASDGKVSVPKFGGPGKDSGKDQGAKAAGNGHRLGVTGGRK